MRIKLLFGNQNSDYSELQKEREHKTKDRKMELVRGSKRMSNFKLPKGEIIWETWHDSTHTDRFVVTSKPVRDAYFLYEVVDGELKKVGRAKNPYELAEKFDVRSRLTKDN